MNPSYFHASSSWRVWSHPTSERIPHSCNTPHMISHGFTRFHTIPHDINSALSLRPHHSLFCSKKSVGTVSFGVVDEIASTSQGIKHSERNLL